MNLGVARKHAGLTQSEASKLSGIPLGTLRRWEQGVNEPDMRSLAQLAALYGTTTDTLIGTQFADKAIVKAVPASGSLPAVGCIAAGTPVEAIELDGERLWCPPPLIERYPRAFFLRVRGDSMDTVYPDGCWVLIDPDQTTIVSGQRYAVLVNGYDATLKTCFAAGNAVVLHPESSNPAHRDMLVSPSDPDAPYFRVVGRAVWFQGDAPR
jgi:repressor LexA